MEKVREAYTILILSQAKLPDFYDYEPEIIIEALNISSVECEALLCAQEVFQNSTAFEEWHVFEKAIVVFNGRPADFMTTQELAVPEIVWGILTMRKIDPVSTFSSEVLGYIAVYLHEEGFVNVPPAIEHEKCDDGLGIQYFLDKLNKNKVLLSDEAKKIHEKKHDLVSEYSKDRQSKLEKELMTEEI